MTAASQMLEIPEVRKLVSPISVDQYHSLPEFNKNGRRTELIRGIVIEKRPKSPQHCTVARCLYDRLHIQIPRDLLVRQHDPLTLVDSEPEPDIAVVQRSIGDYRSAHPTTAVLVIEVSIDSIRIDREKAGIYASGCVEEYWIVQPVERRVEVYRRPEHGVYLDRVVVEGSATLQCASLPFVRVNLGELFE